jgi:tetratricopeptide (TPR) repeat protein
VALSLYLVGDRLRQLNKLQAADSILSAAYSVQRKVLGEGDPDLFYTLRSLAQTLESEGNLEESERVHRQALASYHKQGDMESSEALSEVENFVRVLKEEKKFADAEQLLDETLTPELAAKPSSERLLTLRADIRSRLGLWQGAAADAQQALAYQPADKDLYAMAAALLIQANQRSEYEQFRNQLVSTFGDTTNIYVADEVAKACLFLPISGTNAETVYHLADLPVTGRTGDLDALPFFEVCKALSEYRQGHYEIAIEWAQLPLKVAGNYSHGHAYAVLAMANWRLGNPDEARAMLAKGQELAPRNMPPGIAGEPGNAWQAWLFARIQLDEAGALMQSVPATQPGQGR